MEKLLEKIISKITWDNVKAEKQYLKNNKPTKIIQVLTELLKNVC
jgi:hypothetical protein